MELGKKENGTILITASRQENFVLIRIEDDGCGIDTNEIRKVALKKGIISRESAEQLQEEEAMQLIFTPGLSTSDNITDISGRGIGMDVVKNRVERLGGSVKVESKPGIGSRFELKLPLTIAVYQAMESETQIAGRKVYKVPIMEGDFLAEENIGAIAGIAGGNFFIFGDSQMTALTAAEAAVDAIAELEGTITPFPGGIVASGSKSGANKYKFLKATANERFCPSIKDKVENTEIPADVNAVYEIVINGLDEESIKAAMRTAKNFPTAAALCVAFT